MPQPQISPPHKIAMARPRAGAPRVAQQGTPAAHRDWARAVALVRDGAWPEAARLLERAVRASPRVPLYWLNLASVRRKLKRHGPAIEAARRAVELDGSDITACHMLAELLRINQRDAEALRVLLALPPQVPRDAQHWLLEGSLRMSQRQNQEAAMAFLQVLALKPADLEAYMQLGFALANLKQYAESAECFRTITLLEPSALGAAIYAGHYAAWACDWRQGADDAVRMDRALALQHDGARAPSFSPFCLLSMNDAAAQHLAAARLEARRIADTERRLADWTAPSPGPLGHPLAAEALDKGRCRIGFVSADFRTHATSMLLVRTLERLDRSRFEVVLYSHGADDGSELRARLVSSADRFVDCTEMNAAEQAERIRGDGIAILVDMSGYTASTRLGVFALRPAPVQVLWLAYPSTVGGDFIDYIVGDPILTPLAHQEDFAECIAQLPVTYEPTDERREHPQPWSRAECGLPEDAFVYACFNQSYKITEEVFSRWCRILQRVPGGVLWLLVPQEGIQAALRERAAERGVDPARLIFAPFVTPGEHLARLPQADLFLDTFPYGAHTTCSDALWMGLPVLTQLGRSFSARVAASLLHAVGLPELVVDNDTDYEERAVALATLPGELERARDHLWDNRMDLPLFDNERFTRELQALFLRMAGRWRAGLAPQPLAAQPFTDQECA